MKVEMTIPTEQYGNVRPTVEFPDDYSVEKVAEYAAINYRIFADAFADKPQDTLSDKDFTDIIYGCLHNTKELTADKWESMNAAQQNMLKCLKNALTRKKPNPAKKVEEQMLGAMEMDKEAYQDPNN